MNIWRDICVNALESGQLDAIKEYIVSDVGEAGCLDDIKAALEGWIADIIDIEEAMNGSRDD